MKRFLVLSLVLLAFVGLYNASVIRTAFVGFLANESYGREDFLSAQKRYESLAESSSGNILLHADILYNLGNSYYRLGEQVEGSERIRLWKEAIGNYTKSLRERTDQESEENLAFVKEKLKEEEQQQQEKNKPKPKDDTPPKDTPEKSPEGGTGTETLSGKQDSSKGSSGSASGTSKEASGTGAIPKQNWSNAGVYNPIGGSGSDDATKGLSDADREDLKNYTKGLKQFEKQNGKLLNPDKPNGVGSISDQIRNFFGNDSFFQDVLPTDDNKKDW